MRRLHPFTALGALLLVGGAAMSLDDLGALGHACLCTAYVFGLMEFKKYTSNAQFALIMVAGAVLGISMDLSFGLFPFVTITMVLCGAIIVMRQLFMQTFTYVNFLWVEPAMLLAAILSYAWALHSAPFNWELVVLPLAGIGPSTWLALSYWQDGRAIKRKVGQGYRIQVGKPAPDFVLPDQDGNLIRLSDYKGKHPVMLIFVRGDWCPGCHMMLRTYEKGRDKFMEKGVHVLGIGPDNIDVNKNMVERLGVGYRMLSDDGQRISSQYGVVYTNPVLETTVKYEEGIPLPASFLVDINGIVRYVSRPDRVGEFLDPSLIFNVLAQFPSEADPRRKAA